MFESNAARITAILAAAVWSGIAIQKNYSVSLSALTLSDEDKAVNTLQNLQSDGLGSGCQYETTGPCVAYPIFVKAKASDGTQKELKLDYVVGTDLVSKVKQDFGGNSYGVLRQIEKSLHMGKQVQDPEVQHVCENALDHIMDHLPYGLNPEVELNPRIEKRVAKIAEVALKASGKKITITSGTRSVQKQAEAMRIKLALGDNVTRLYANKKAARKVVNAYKYAKKIGGDDDQVRNTIASVIDKQVKSGVYLSNHLREGAVDIRTRDMTPEEKQAVLHAIKQIPGVKAIDESTPPHIHLDIL